MVNTDRLCMGCMNDNGGENICPICGYDSSLDNSSEQLAVGTWLNANRYLIGRAIEENGDSVTYIAWDNDNNAVVNIKEYFPTGVAVRSHNRLTVTPADGKALPYTQGMDEFVNLFTKLGKMPKSAAILHIVDGFESGGTVYAVQSTISGTTLKAFLIKNGGVLKWEQLKPLIMPLIATVKELGEAGVVHRGISPENIIVGRDGKMRLLGFCIKQARIAYTEFESQLYPGYAAPEQYLENDQYGDSCDVYALGAIIFRCLVGIVPPDAKDRLMNDKLSIPAKITETVPRGILVTVANALKVDKSERVPSVERLYCMLEAVSSSTVTLSDIREEAPEKAKKKGGSKALYVAISSGITAVIIIGLLVAAYFIFDIDVSNLFESSKPTQASSSSIELPEPSSSEEQIIEPGQTLYDVPDLIGQKYTDIAPDLTLNYSHFKFVVVGRQHSSTVAKGCVCSQSVEAGAEYPRDTVISLYISAGPETITMPNLTGKTIEEAKDTLFETGFYYDNITFRKKDSSKVDPGYVCDSSVRFGEKVSVNDPIVIYYRENEELADKTSSTDSNTSSQTN